MVQEDDMLVDYDIDQLDQAQVSDKIDEVLSWV
jgi:hypothetical protein